MKTNRIGQTDIRVTEVSFGCSALGNLYRRIEDADTQAVLARAWQRGIRYFDTAPHYGRGLSEARLGKFLRQQDRDQYVVSTKVGRLLSPGPKRDTADGFIDPLPNDVRYDYSGDGIEAAFEQSCERLGTSTIDILYVHDIGEYCHGAEANASHLDQLLDSGIARLEKLKADDRIRAFGLGVNENVICLRIMEHARLDVILLAGRLTLLDRSAEDALLARCEAEGTSLVLGGVFNSGILATGPVEGATYDYAPASQKILDQAQRLQDRATEAGVPLATAALHFGLRYPQVASILLGTGKVRSLDRNLDALESPLGSGVIDSIAAAI